MPYRLKLEVEVISDTPFGPDISLHRIAESITTGGDVGNWEVLVNEEISGIAAFRYLQEMDSDPEMILGDEAWKYELHPGDEIRIENNPLVIQSIDWKDDGVAIIRDTDGMTHATRVEEIS